MVKSVKDFFTEIKNIDKKSNVFYRGHSNEEYDLLPGIYRENEDGKNLVDFEDKIFREVISKSPIEFIGKNTLESLVLLQHYGTPTRILDLTENALIALYFACNDNFNKNGEVIIFDIPYQNICNYDSDRVTIISNIAKCDSNIYHMGTKKNKEKLFLLEEKKIKNKINNISVTVSTSNIINEDEESELKKYYEEEIRDEIDINKIDKSFNEFYQDWISKDKKYNKIYYKNSFIKKFQEFINNDKDKMIYQSNTELFGKLLHCIREDKSYFLPIINPEDIDNVYAVKPKLDNPRIIRQQGAFLIFGVKETDFSKVFEQVIKKPISKISKDWVIKGKEGGKNHRIIINKKYKKIILEELNILGINTSTLFPEIDKISDWVKNKYQEKLHKI